MPSSSTSKNSTMSKSEKPTASKPKPSTSNASKVTSSTSKPSSSTSKPSSSSTSKPSSSSTSKPSSSITSKPSSSTSKPSSTTSKPSSSSTSKPSSSITSKPSSSTSKPSSTTSKPSSPGTSKPSSSTSKPSSSTSKATSTTSKSSSSTSIPSSSNTSKPNSSSSKPSSSTSKPSSPSTSKPSSSSTSKPSSKTSTPTSKPSSSNSTKDKSQGSSSTSKDIEKIHPSHPSHPLEKVYRKHAYKCNGCKIKGVGERYRCEPCEFNLHRDCMLASSSMKFEGYNYRFLERPLRCRSAKCSHGDYCRSCDACGMTIEGFVYHCKENDKDFHPSCAKLKSEIRIEDVIFKLEKQGSAKCIRCQRKKLEGTSKKIPGWSYVASRLGYTLHVHCLMDLAIQCSSDNFSNNKATTTKSTLKNVALPNESKSKSMIIGTSRNGDYMRLLETFLKIVLPVLMGAHPATFILSLAAYGVKELVDILFQD